MKRFANVLSLVCFWAAGLTAAFFMIAPWIIGSHGGSGAGVLLLLGATFGFPAVLVVAIVGLVARWFARSP